jgi:hypothetical protein
VNGPVADRRLGTPILEQMCNADSSGSAPVDRRIRVSAWLTSAPFPLYQYGASHRGTFEQIQDRPHGTTQRPDEGDDYVLVALGPSSRERSAMNPNPSRHTPSSAGASLQWARLPDPALNEITRDSSSIAPPGPWHGLAGMFDAGISMAYFLLASDRRSGVRAAPPTSCQSWRSSPLGAAFAAVRDVAVVPGDGL